MRKRANGKLVGVISDTHNLLRPEAVAALEGVDLIIHAGDICEPQILERLSSIASLAAVRGNNDKGAWAMDIPVFDAVEIEGISIYIIHDIKDININPAYAGFKVVISGHSHKPSVKEQKGVIYLNPGSAGPRRFNLPVSIARLKVYDKNVETEIIELPV